MDNLEDDGFVELVPAGKHGAVAADLVVTAALMGHSAAPRVQFSIRKTVLNGFGGLGYRIAFDVTRRVFRICDQGPFKPIGAELRGA